MTHRPTEILNRAMTAIPDLSQDVNAAYALRAAEKLSAETWPPWCFIPRRVWREIVRGELGAEYLNTMEGRQTLLAVIAAGTWRYGQGIYEFDEDVLTAVAESAIPKHIPPDVLMRLPEWCIYVPTPGLTFLGDEMHGFFAQLDRGFDSKRQDTLHITIDAGDWLSVHPIFLDGQGVLESVTAMYNEHIARAPTEAAQLPDGYAEILAQNLTAAVSLILYICGDEPDISHRKTPNASPQRLAPKRVKGATKMFPATSPTVWQVGQSIGDTLRAAMSGLAGSGGGGRKRPHMRKGHHHGYWSGPRDGEQTFALKWLPPMMVAGDREDVPDTPEE